MSYRQEHIGWKYYDFREKHAKMIHMNRTSLPSVSPPKEWVDVPCMKLVLFLIATLSSQVPTQADDGVVFPKKVKAILETRCVDCHGRDTSEANVRLDNLEQLNTAAQLELLNRVQDQLFFGLMPPKEAEAPDEMERALLSNWLRNELRNRNASKLDEKLREPAFGNYVDHVKLFDGSTTEKPFTPARRWLVSPQIFHERVNAVFKLTGRSRQRSFYGVTNPIVLPEHSGVRYYDTTALDGGHLLIMLNNARWISQKQIFAATH
ncbi:MAG: hypothetical protein KDA84_03850, partial [Planctomycetaceae bacterium]|nr:hypothetical protein [Planctomycetaceae bacterium]